MPREGTDEGNNIVFFGLVANAGASVLHGTSGFRVLLCPLILLFLGSYDNAKNNTIFSVMQCVYVV